MVSWWSNDCLEKYVRISKLTTISIEDICAVRVDALQPSKNPLSFTVSVSFANLSLQRCCAEKLLSFSGYCKRAFPPGPLSKRPRIFCALLNSIELYQMMPSGFPVMRRRNQGNKYNLQFVYILHNISPRNVPSQNSFCRPCHFFGPQSARLVLMIRAPVQNQSYGENREHSVSRRKPNGFATSTCV
jgi:hypothetical protein